DEIDDSPGCLDVACDDGGRRLRVDDAAFRGGDGDRGEGAAGCGDVGVGETADDEVTGRSRHGDRAVHVSLVLRVRAGEVDVDAVAAYLDGGTKLELALRPLEHVAGLASAVRKCADRVPDDPLRVVVERVHRRLDRVESAAFDELGQSSFREVVRRDL